MFKASVRWQVKGKGTPEDALQICGLNSLPMQELYGPLMNELSLATGAARTSIINAAGSNSYAIQKGIEDYKLSETYLLGETIGFWWNTGKNWPGSSRPFVVGTQSRIDYKTRFIICMHVNSMVEQAAAIAIDEKRPSVIALRADQKQAQMEADRLANVESNANLSFEKMVGTWISSAQKKDVANMTALYLGATLFVGGINEKNTEVTFFKLEAKRPTKKFLNSFKKIEIGKMLTVTYQGCSKTRFEGTLLTEKGPLTRYFVFICDRRYPELFSRVFISDEKDSHWNRTDENPLY